jgi:hypothetical protein
LHVDDDREQSLTGLLEGGRYRDAQRAARIDAAHVVDAAQNIEGVSVADPDRVDVDAVSTAREVRYRDFDDRRLAGDRLGVTHHRRVDLDVLCRLLGRGRPDAAGERPTEESDHEQTGDDRRPNGAHPIVLRVVRGRREV